MKKYKCPFCGNISDEIIGFRDQTEWDAYCIDDNGDIDWVSEQDTYHGELVFECMECNETTMQYKDYEVIENESD